MNDPPPTPEADAPSLPPAPALSTPARAVQVLVAASRLGVTSFGGPTAHIGYFRAAYVTRRRWLTERDFAELVGLCQVLPGPASSQLGVAIGALRAGWLGAACAFIGFTLPSAVLMTIAGYGLINASLAHSGLATGLRLAAVAVVAQAVIGMARSGLRSSGRVVIAATVAVLVLAQPAAATQLVVIGLGAVAGFALRAHHHPPPAPQRAVVVSHRGAVAVLAVWAGLLIGLPVAHRTTTNHVIAMSDAFYRSGALGFGGGHVVLPLLHAQVVDPHWVSNDQFLAGYGAAQALPGPLFTFAAFLGAAQRPPPRGVAGALIALVAIFMPGLLLVLGVLPFWQRLQSRQRLAPPLAGINAAVVGLLAAAWYQPVLRGSVHDLRSAAVGLGLAGLLMGLRVAPVIVVGVGAVAGALLLS